MHNIFLNLLPHKTIYIFTTHYSLCILISSPRIPHYVNLIGSTQQMLLFVRVFIEIIIIYQTQMYIMTILKINYKIYMKTCVAPFKNIFTTYLMLMWRSHINDNQFDVCTAITCGLFYLWTARVAFIYDVTNVI